MVLPQLVFKTEPDDEEELGTEKYIPKAQQLADGAVKAY